MSNNEALKLALKRLVLKECRVAGMTVENLRDSEPIIGGSMLPLDSLDAVEIVTAIERNLGMRFDDLGASRKLFKSFDAMTSYVAENASQDRIQSFLSAQA